MPRAPFTLTFDTVPYFSANVLVLFIEYNNPDYKLVNAGDIGVSSGFAGHSIVRSIPGHRVILPVSVVYRRR